MARPDGLDLPVLRCRACRGAWLELAEIECRLSDPSLLWNSLAHDEATSGLTCPACRDRSLSRAFYADNEIDWCPACKGIFLDAGELDSIRLTMRDERHGPAAGMVATGAGNSGGWIVGELIIEAVGWVLEQIADAT